MADKMKAGKLVTSVPVSSSSTEYGGSVGGGKVKYASGRKYPDLDAMKNQKGPKPAY